MKFIPPEYIIQLADAIYPSLVSVQDLVDLLNGLSRDFDALTGRGIPLKQNVMDVCSAACAQGWAIDLFNAAVHAKPDNEALRKFTAIVAALPDGLPSTGARSGRPSLECGRAGQWTSVQRCARTWQHQIILVMGELGQGSLHFRERVQTYLTDPRCSPLIVQWETRPHSQREYLAALAGPLKCTADNVGEALRARLGVQNVVLLHDRIREGFNDPTLIKYYSEWLPELIARSANAPRLKSVQPIEWPPDKVPGFLERLWRSANESRQGRAGALSLKEQLVERQKEWMPVVALKDLSNLTDEELTDFLDSSILKGPQKARLLSTVRQCRPVPEEQFESIDNHWNEVLSLS